MATRSLHPFFSAAQLVVIAMLTTILLGTLILSLPACRTTHVSLLDLFFTVTSTTCVTGLLVVPLTAFTSLGHLILLILMQIGGLSLITITFVIVYWIFELRLSTHLIAEQVFEQESLHNLRSILTFTIGSTLILELIGATVIFFSLSPAIPFLERILLSAFHAVSAFCNAGIVLPQIQEVGPALGLYIPTLILVYLGGIGFSTMYEVLLHFFAKQKKKWHRLSLNTTVILYGSTSLIIASTIVIGLLERYHAFAHLSTPWSFAYALFHAVSFKSSGFLLVPLSALSMATLLVMILISFIGSAPGSTGSGVKITTLAVYLATIKSAFMSNPVVFLQHRQVPNDLIYKSVAIIAISISWILVTVFCLLITEPNKNFFDLFMISASAYTTLGLSLSSPAALTPFGKIFIILSMFVGRVGSYTLILAIKLARHREIHGYKYPVERVMLG